VCAREEEEFKSKSVRRVGSHSVRCALRDPREPRIRRLTEDEDGGGEEEEGKARARERGGEKRHIDIGAGGGERERDSHLIIGIDALADGAIS
jgi:hypothetical protein